MRRGGSISTLKASRRLEAAAIAVGSPDDNLSESGLRGVVGVDVIVQRGDAG